jgi:uncharacterized protein YqjF (DUF2071 family)
MDFNRHILDVVDHRPWPMPDSPWLMTQTWHDLLFAHWPLEPSVLSRKIPAPMELDLFNGCAWIAIVPFHMTNVAPRGASALPWLSEFSELNVRTYVSVGNKPGVYFFSLDASNPVAVRAARVLFHLPYYSASIAIEGGDGSVDYCSRRTHARAPLAQLVVRYRAIGPIFQAAVGTIDHFLTERYCLYTADRKGRAFRLQIHHPPWRLQQAEAEFGVNSMTEGLGVDLPAGPPLLHVAKRQDIVAWGLERV